MLTVCAVLRSGGDYTVHYAKNLIASVRRHKPKEEWRFALLCDSPIFSQGVIESCVPLENQWPGWWSKIELFSPAMSATDRLYVDLDTLVIGGLQPLIDAARKCQRPVMLRDFYRDHGYGSGVMFLPAGWGSFIYNRFIQEPEAIMERYKRGGDQAFLEQMLPFKAACVWQDIVGTDAIVSFKPFPGAELAEAPKNARIVCFHGKPRPAELPKEHWASKVWRNAA